jgi:hypothetical protein
MVVYLQVMLLRGEMPFLHIASLALIVPPRHLLLPLTLAFLLVAEYGTFNSRVPSSTIDELLLYVLTAAELQTTDKLQLLLSKITQKIFLSNFLIHLAHIVLIQLFLLSFCLGLTFFGTQFLCHFLCTL